MGTTPTARTIKYRRNNITAMDYKQIKTLKGQVENILQDYPETRDSDVLLTCRIWVLFFPHFIKREGDPQTGTAYVYLKHLADLPREDNVKRVRAHFQNDRHQYLPRTWAVAKARKITEDEWRVAMGYPTKDTTGTGAPTYVPPSETKRSQGNLMH